MKDILFTFQTLFFVLLVFLSFSQSKYKHNDFKVTFPSDPTIDEQDFPTAEGTFKMYSYMTETADGVHMLSYIDYPSEYVSKLGINAFLQQVKGGFIGSLEITVIEENKIYIAGNEGLYFKASGNNYYCIKNDYLVGNRLYQLGILRTDRYPTDKETNSFFNSFKLKSGKIKKEATTDKRLITIYRIKKMRFFYLISEK